MSTKPQPEPCKHCGQFIELRGTDWYHRYSGKHHCDVEPHGFHAEPVGTPCTADGPNPCLGAGHDRLRTFLRDLSGVTPTVDYRGRGA